MLVAFELCRGAFRVPVGTGCKLNVHKTFRRRLGRLLNVLCTFNLRPVSIGVLSYIYEGALLQMTFSR